MRHHSERVPEKNYRPCGGMPLYHHILRTLLACPEIDTIVVDTDSPTIMSGVRDHFPLVQLLERPEHLRAGTIPMNEVLLHDTAQVPADFYLQTHSTNPLLRSQTVSRAVTTFLETYPAHDSMFSVTRLHTRFWDQHGRPLNHNPEVLLRTQDLPPIYEENSCLYLFSRQTLVTRRNRIGERPYLFEIDRTEAWDIDELLDFEIVDYLLSRSI
jgi:CMP-N-acetylneuraminic acid synthetase